VIFGNLLVLPVEKSLLYVQPVYLQNDEAQIPEFQRIVAVLGDSVGWGETFAEAVRDLLDARARDAASDDDGSSAGDSGAADDGAAGETSPDDAQPGDGDTDGAASAPDTSGLEGLTQAQLLQVLAGVSAAYDRAEACQQRGDTVCHARELERVEQLLDDARGDAA